MTSPIPSQLVVSCRFSINDKVLVNGKVCGNGNGTGNSIIKSNAIMYVVGMIDPNLYTYCIGVANTMNGIRIGWCKIEDLVKVSSTSNMSIRTHHVVIANDLPKKKQSTLLGTYTVTCRNGIHLRQGAGSGKTSIVLLPLGHAVDCSGEYTNINGTKWLYVETIYKKIKYIGFCSKNYLKIL